jgi:hypothetical protein
MSPRTAKLVNLRLKAITPVQIQDTVFAELKNETSIDVSDLQEKFSEVAVVKSPQTERKQAPVRQGLIDPRRSQQLGTHFLFWKLQLQIF